jgi:hypothetical protein
MFRKQNVWVRQYPNTEVFKSYKGIPCEQYLSTCKTQLDAFFVKHPNSNINTSGKNYDNVEKIDTSIVGDELKIVLSFSDKNSVTVNIIPSKFGIDTVDLNKPRIWFFCEDNLDDFNLISKL